MLARAHGQDDRGGSGGGIAAGEHTGQAGLTVLVGGHTALPGLFQALGTLGAHGVGRGAQRHDDRVGLHLELAALHGDRAAAAGGVRLAQFHTDAGHGLDMALLIPLDGNGIGEQVENDALLLGVVDLLGAGGELRLGAAVDDVDLSPQALGAPGGVHSHVAAAHHGHLLVVEDGGLGALLIGLHQVDAGEVLIGGVDAHQSLAGDLHKHGQAGSGGDEHRLIATLKQLGDGEDLADDHVQLDVHPHLLQVGHLPGHDGLGQAELRDAVGQHAAGGVERLKHRDVIAHAGQLPGAGQAGRAGADDRRLVAVLGGGGHIGNALLGRPVGHEALHPADGHGLALHAPDALALTLVLLGAYAAGNGRQGIGVGQDLIGGGDVALRHLGQEVRDGDAHGAAADAGGVFTVDAPLGLVHGLLQGIALGHLQEVGVADLGILLRHGSLRHLHISH